MLTIMMKNIVKKAAQAFGELLTLVEGGQTQYALAEFKYKNVYNHEKSSDAKTCYSDIFLYPSPRLG